MKILLISNMFPPHIMGGAEMAAHSLAIWLSWQGHQVHVLTSAHQPSLAGVAAVSENLTVERRFFPNLYQIYRAEAQNFVMKAAWHLHDHFHLVSERIVTEVIRRVQPEIVNTHSLQGIGYNLLRAIGKSGLPCVQTLHDFAMLCINVNRFRDGRECERHHIPCFLSTQLKRLYLENIKRLAFWSPSHALLQAYQKHLPRHARSEAIPLPLIFDQPPSEARSGEGPIRLLYVGQVTPWKGVGFLLQVIASLPREAAFQIEVIGGGSDLANLKEQYRGETRIIFHGKLPPEKIGRHMAKSDLLLTPSLWFENAPLVISQAIQAGLPVFASDIGGLPELVDDYASGRLIPGGDHNAWRNALLDVVQDPSLLANFRQGTLGMQHRFSTDHLGHRVVELYEQTIGSKSSVSLLPC